MDFAGYTGRRRERRFENDAADCVVGGKMGGYGSAERLAKRDDGLRVEPFCADEILIRRFGIEIEPGFARLAITVAVASIFQR